MYFQFLIEDKSTVLLVDAVMKKLKNKYSEQTIAYDTKSFSGIGHLTNRGSFTERKTGGLLNNLKNYSRAFDKALKDIEHAAIIVILDNDNNDIENFKRQIEQIAKDSMQYTDYAVCIAVKEMEAWLLGDVDAIETAYPNVKKKFIEAYEQDSLCDTWQVLAEAIYPGGLKKLRKTAQNSYSEIGKAKCEWARRIGEQMLLDNNESPSFQKFVNELQLRIQAECA